MSWVVFSYSLPAAGRSSPRVAIWRRLRTAGAISPKGGVYVLPARDECVEAFQWLAQEVEHAKGEALLMRVERFEGLTDTQLIALFRAARKKDYDELDTQAAQLERSLSGGRTSTHGDRARAHSALAKLRERYADIIRLDFFDCPERAHVAARLSKIEQILSPNQPAAVRVPPAVLAAYRRERWVTRPSPHVDRLACAWLIRRFVNTHAVIRYARTPGPDEVAFDMPNAPFAHRGNLCTFEVMTQAFGLDDPGLRGISEIVHEIDLRDGRFARPETSGIDAVLKGWRALSDAEREAHGIALFEGLYAALSRVVPTRRDGALGARRLPPTVAQRLRRPVRARKRRRNPT